MSLRHPGGKAYVEIPGKRIEIGFIHRPQFGEALVHGGAFAKH
jgi:hypothetical protein